MKSLFYHFLICLCSAAGDKTQCKKSREQYAEESHKLAPGEIFAFDLERPASADYKPWEDAEYLATYKSLLLKSPWLFNNKSRLATGNGSFVHAADFNEHDRKSIRRINLWNKKSFYSENIQKKKLTSFSLNEIFFSIHL